MPLLWILWALWLCGRVHSNSLPSVQDHSLSTGTQRDQDHSSSSGAHGDQDDNPPPGADRDQNHASPPETQRDQDHSPAPGTHRSRTRRSITQSEMLAILDYHNQVRAHVYPPAANMELMQWDTELAQWAEVWAASCQWEHGPAHMLSFFGQNLSVRTGGYQSVLQLLTPWFEEVFYYVFPYPNMCRPLCPLTCYAPMCTHYTQMVWASTSRVGCALHTCSNMSVWGAVWRDAAFLVCNYSPKGNWIGEAPYRVGVPCSMCPSTYRGRCSNNLCVPEPQSNYVTWFK
ncbi:peptidase inhibitor 15-like [Boleophthalmus pectinirostris]|uniref:peptidase inhibitor 15-like n=1 Tax=Boleophthalmus pectinirostris TaxID=150288 RepID=UPI000A1C7578|nr:peptidase inhibitor 15-like [Boleophthalmus pectinirostris]